MALAAASRPPRDACPEVRVGVTSLREGALRALLSGGIGARCEVERPGPINPGDVSDDPQYAYGHGLTLQGR
jgi:hypothetical protein